MTSREFAEWQEYYKLAPFGDDWLQTSMIATSNLQPWTKQKLEPDMFVPRLKPKQTKEQVIAALNMFARMHNEAAKRKRA
jgi:hypothetical protein